MQKSKWRENHKGTLEKNQSNTKEGIIGETKKNITYDIEKNNEIAEVNC